MVRAEVVPSGFLTVKTELISKVITIKYEDMVKIDTVLNENERNNQLILHNLKENERK